MTSNEADRPSVREVRGTGVPVRGNDIDTDQIIPARFLKAITFDGLGEHAFHDQRFGEDGEPTGHPFDRERHADASVLVVNANFGCGSSREHAPRALARWGIEAIVGESFAEIFAGNCLVLGIPTVTAEAAEAVGLQDAVEEHPEAEIRVDVEGGTVSALGRTIDVEVDETQRRALVEGIWDPTALMRANERAVRETADSLPYVDLSEDRRPGSRSR